MARRSRPVQLLADAALEERQVDDAVDLGDADQVGETAEGGRRDSRAAARPEIVGMRGSSQPSTTPSLTSARSLRLLSTVWLRLSRANSICRGWWMPSWSRNQS